KEIVGFKVINELLNIFTKTLLNNLNNSLSAYDNLVLNTLNQDLNLKENRIYNLLLDVCQYVSQMSDSRAILTYKKFNGNQF
ncbi:MAG: dGTPase, partial [Bacteroidota bacterium]